MTPTDSIAAWSLVLVAGFVLCVIAFGLTMVAFHRCPRLMDRLFPPPIPEAHQLDGFPDRARSLHRGEHVGVRPRAVPPTRCARPADDRLRIVR